MRKRLWKLRNRVFGMKLFTAPYQNTYFNANCTILGPPDVLGVAFAAEQPVVALALAAEQRILPKVLGWPRITPGLPGRKLLVTLKASARISILLFSRIWNCRDTASLQSQ